MIFDGHEKRNHTKIIQNWYTCIYIYHNIIVYYIYTHISPPHIQEHVNSFRFQKTPWFTGSADGHSNEWQGGMRSTKGGALLPSGGSCATKTPKKVATFEVCFSYPNSQAKWIRTTTIHTTSHNYFRSTVNAKEHLLASNWSIWCATRFLRVAKSFNSGYLVVISTNCWERSGLRWKRLGLRWT